MSKTRKSVYVAFSGGGAKAIIHIGALDYIEKHHDIKGVSGTSAGAIVAALKASGFTSKDIFVPPASEAVKGYSEIFEKIKKNNNKIKFLGDLLGGEGVSGINSFYDKPIMFIIKRTFNKILKKPATYINLIILSFIIIIYYINFYDIYTDVLLFVVFHCIFAFFFLYTTILFFSTIDGIFVSGISDTKMAISLLCKEIGEKINILDRDVVMGDFKIPLYIISTNITGRSPEIFSSISTPSVKLFDALSSSVSIPGIFPAYKIKQNQYVDGGIISNLPAFVFSDHLDLHPERKVIALRIVNVREKSTKKIGIFMKCIKRNFQNTLSVVNGLLGTVFTGTQDLAHINLNLVQAILPTPLRMIDFNLTTEQAATAYRQGALEAEKLLLQSFSADDIYSAACHAISKDVLASLKNLNAAQRKSGANVRVAMVFRSKAGSPIMKSRYHYGFNESSDQGMLIPMEGSLSGVAWNNQKSVYVMGAPSIKKMLSNYPHIQAKLDRNMQWILSVPIVMEGKTAFVINIDSNTKLLEYRDMSDSNAQRVSNFLSHIAAVSKMTGEAVQKSIVARMGESQ